MFKSKLISIASKAYPDGLVKACFDQPKRNFGDGLAKFIADELDDTYETGASDEKQLQEAIRVIGKARAELLAVELALQEELDLPAKELEQKREAAANKAFEKAKLPPIADSDNGWCKDGGFWTKGIFWEMESGPSKRGDFGVEFKEGTAKIIDTWHQ